MDDNAKKDKITSKCHEVTVPNNVKRQESVANQRKEEASPRIPEEENNLEDVFSDLNLSGRYHLTFLLLMSILIATNAGYPVHYIFSVENITYWCKYSRCTDTDLSKLKQNSSIDYKCHKYELFYHNGTCTEEDFDKSNYTDCSEWIYEKPNSFVGEFNLGCEDWKRSLVGTMHSTGFMIGLLFVGPLSDRFGRKKILIFNTLFAAVVGVIKSRVMSYWVFIAFETLEAMFGDNYAATYTLAVEMMTTKNRPVVVLVFAMSDTIGVNLMSLMDYLSPNWRIFLLLIYLPAFVAILYIFWIDESPRWLFSKGRKAEALEIIKKAYKTNNLVIDESRIVNLTSKESSKTTLRSSLKVTFSSRKLFIRLILCICIWVTGLFNTYSLLINSVSLEGNKYLNFGLVSLSTTVAGTILLFVLTKFQRKVPLIFALTLTGVFCISQSFVPKGYRWLSTLLYVCGKINASITVHTAYMYTSELFPTYTRNTMLSLCSSMGRIGSILAPLTPLLLKYWSSFPSFLVGILSLVTASIVTLMPDTSEDVLPDNVKQAEALGTKQKAKEMSTL